MVRHLGAERNLTILEPARVFVHRQRIELAALARHARAKLGFLPIVEVAQRAPRAALARVEVGELLLLIPELRFELAPRAEIVKLQLPIDHVEVELAELLA